MKTYRIIAEARFTIVTEVKAHTQIEAEQIAQDRDVDVCIHGSEFCEGMTNPDEFSLEDGCCNGYEIDYAEEI